MIVYRLTKEKYKSELSGKGAEINGGRWNSKGRQIIYTGESRALCTTEIAVHTPLGIVPMNYYLQSIEIPNLKMLEITDKHLEKDWRNFPHEVSTNLVGDKFIEENKYLIMKVPSAVIQDEYNYLINPNHKYYDRVKLLKVEEFKFDKRLFTK
jgi:RES domain-containing protein